jgi:hypothetical protein
MGCERILDCLAKIGLIFFMCGFLHTSSLKAEKFQLMIEDVSGLKTSWPMIGSLAFPQGVLKDISSVRLMSNGVEVPSQVDVSATWQDGSIRWALVGFTASPQGKYYVEYGARVKRSQFKNSLKVIPGSGAGFTIDTGVASFRFDKDKLLPEEGWIISGKEKKQFLKNSGAGAYLIDNKGRRATVAGELAEIENVFLKEGPGRVALKRSGWYVTSAGEKLARAEVWFYFAVDSPVVKLTHSIIFTENTNNVWFKDYGLEFKTASSPLDVYCPIGEFNSEDIRKVTSENQEVYLLQDMYPHFAERVYKAVIGKGEQVVEEFKIAGDWAHGDYGNFGVTLVMPFLAERFPKEISFGPQSTKAVLWSGRSD